MVNERPSREARKCRTARYRAIKSAVLLFGVAQLLGKECQWFLTLPLAEYRPDSEIEGVGGEEKGSSSTRMDEHRRLGEHGLDLIKSGKLRRVPTQDGLLGLGRRHQSMERGEDRGNAGHKAVVEVNAADELLEVHLGDRPRDGQDGGDLGRQWLDAAGGHSVTQECHRRAPKHTLVAVNGEAGSTETLEECADVGNMGRPVRAGDKDVIQVHKYER